MMMMMMLMMMTQLGTTIQVREACFGLGHAPIPGGRRSQSFWVPLPTSTRFDLQQRNLVW